MSQPEFIPKVVWTIERQHLGHPQPWVEYLAFVGEDKEQKAREVLAFHRAHVGFPVRLVRKSGSIRRVERRVVDNTPPWKWEVVG